MFTVCDPVQAGNRCATANTPESSGIPCERFEFSWIQRFRRASSYRALRWILTHYFIIYPSRVVRSNVSGVGLASARNPGDSMLATRVQSHFQSFSTTRFTGIGKLLLLVVVSLLHCCHNADRQIEPRGSRSAAGDEVGMTKSRV